MAGLMRDEADEESPAR